MKKEKGGAEVGGKTLSYTSLSLTLLPILLRRERKKEGEECMKWVERER